MCVFIRVETDKLSGSRLGFVTQVVTNPLPFYLRVCPSTTLPSPFSLAGWSFHKSCGRSTVTWGQLLKRPVPAVVVLQQSQMEPSVFSDEPEKDRTA